MKSLTALFLICFSLPSYAEVSIFPKGSGGSLSIASNEVVLISAYLNEGGTGYDTSIVYGGSTNNLPLEDYVRIQNSKSIALAGPMLITFGSSNNHLISSLLSKTSELGGLNC